MQYGEGYAMFCDEVRQERNGKDILIGVYSNGEYNAPTTPEEYTASSYTIIATAMLDPADPPEKLKEITVLFPGEAEPIFQISLDPPEEAYTNIVAPDALSLFPRTPITARTIMVLKNIKFKESGFVRVIMSYGEEKFLLGRLKINFKEYPASDASQPSSPAT
ncbi:MAG: hypothetical protein V7703_03480 [Hyphomicrobiales bacterium]